jgi:hypothetical protein
MSHTQKSQRRCPGCSECGSFSASSSVPTSTIGYWAHLVVTRFAQRVAQPLQTFVETITRGSTCRLDILLHGQHKESPVQLARSYPSTLPQAVKTKFVGDFGGVHGVL